MRNPLNPQGITDEQRDEEACRKAREVLSWLQPLLENEHFQIFWGMFGEGVLAQQAIALDPKADPKDRENAVHVRHALEQWHLWPQRNRDACIAMLTKQNERNRIAEKTPAPTL